MLHHFLLLSVLGSVCLNAADVPISSGKKSFSWCKIALQDSDALQTGIVRIDKSSGQLLAALMRATNKTVLDAACVALQQFDLKTAIINHRKSRGIETRQLNECTSAILSYYSLDNSDVCVQVKSAIGANDDVEILIVRGYSYDDAVAIYAPEGSIELQKHLLLFFWPDNQKGFDRKVKCTSSNLTIDKHDSSAACSGLIINLLDLLNNKDKKIKDVKTSGCGCSLL